MGRKALPQKAGNSCCSLARTRRSLGHICLTGTQGRHAMLRTQNSVNEQPQRSRLLALCLYIRKESFFTWRDLGPLTWAGLLNYENRTRETAYREAVGRGGRGPQSWGWAALMTTLWRVLPLEPSCSPASPWHTVGLPWQSDA